jgi:hypothetical protein
MSDKVGTRVQLSVQFSPTDGDDPKSQCYGKFADVLVTTRGEPAVYGDGKKLASWVGDDGKGDHGWRVLMPNAGRKGCLHRHVTVGAFDPDAPAPDPAAGLTGLDRELAGLPPE